MLDLRTSGLSLLALTSVAKAPDHRACLLRQPLVTSHPPLCFVCRFASFRLLFALFVLLAQLVLTHPVPALNVVTTETASGH